MAKVAIIMRTRNRKLLLGRALDSVLGQTLRDWALIVVNDGGARDEVEPLVAARRAELGERVTVLHRETSQGMEAASNAGIRASASDYLVIHDDDDSWRPDFLGETVGYLEARRHEPNVRGVIAHSEVVRESIEGGRVVRLGEEPFNFSVRNVTLFQLAAQNFFPPISFLYRRDALDKVGLYREDLPVLGDWDFHLRFLLHYDVGVVPKPLAYYHHRTPLTQGEYANTIFAGEDRHRHYEAVIRNQLLRQDLAAGKLGLGLLVNVAHAVAHSSDDALTLVRGQTETLLQAVDGILGAMRHYAGLVHPTLFGYVKERVYQLGKRTKII